MAIRDSKLYRTEHSTFEAYCKERWGFTANRARRLIGAAEIAENVKSVPTGTIPESESQARPLAKLPADEQPAAWQAATEIRIRAERRLGEMLRAQKEGEGLNTGTRGQLKGRDVSGSTVEEPPENTTPTLADIGISKKLSARAQSIAAIPEDDFEVTLDDRHVH